MEEVSVPGRPLRADAKRNYERIVAAADAAFAEQGAGASLEAIARRAGVGSATLHRHFTTRQALLEAVFHDRVVNLCALAGRLAESEKPRAALLDWLRALASYASTTRGLATSLLPSEIAGSAPEAANSCGAMIRRAGVRLLHAAQSDGTVRTDVSIDDLLKLVTAISLVTEPHSDINEATRLLNLAVMGLTP